LASLLGYLVLIHARLKGWVGLFGTAAGAVLAIWPVAATYLVVNSALAAGLHSYGSGSGNIVVWIAIAAPGELAFLAVSYVRYLMRRRAVEPAPGQRPARQAV
ncbi:MAG: cytochrome C assembly protein, partial [Phycisphaerae bacterium]